MGDLSSLFWSLNVNSGMLLYPINVEKATTLSIRNQMSGVTNYFSLSATLKWNIVNKPFVNADCGVRVSLYFTETNFKPLRLITEAAIMLCQFPSASLSTLLQTGALPRQRLTHLVIRDHLGEASKGLNTQMHARTYSANKKYTRPLLTHTQYTH